MATANSGDERYMTSELRTTISEDERRAGAG